MAKKRADDKTGKGSKNRNAANYKNCLNCNAELQGTFCHQCGQQAANPVPSVGSFIMEYICNMFSFDPLLPPTLKNLLLHPGRLTNEFMAGRFSSYEHPLKLNIFFLLIFITSFLLFSDTNKIENTFDELATNEAFVSYMAISTIQENENMRLRVKESERDTVTLYAPLALAMEYDEIISTVRVLSDSDGEALDTMIVSLPKVLIDEEIVVDNDDGYQFALSSEFFEEDDNVTVQFLSTVWRKISQMIIGHFPLIILLTTPLLAFAVRLIHRNRKVPKINFFVFTLHYTAFLELLLLAIYLLYLTIIPSTEILKWITIIVSTIYLSVAIKRVYDAKNWFRSTLKAMMINLTYLIIGLFTFSFIFVVTILTVIMQSETI